MRAQDFWNEGAVFGATAGALCAFYLCYLVWSPWPNELTLMAIAYPAFGVAWILCGVWLVTRRSLARHLERRKKREADSPPAEEPPPVAHPADPYAEYTSCSRLLWRLETRGDGDGPEADALRERQTLLWEEMNEDQRYKADLGAGDVWKHLHDDGDAGEDAAD